jgi:hypothetical protein
MGRKRMKVSKRDTVDRWYIFSLWGFALFGHKIHHDEEKDVYHNHPWSGISLIFGSYCEEKLGDIPKIKWIFNFIRAKTFHRVTLPNGPVWTLFFHFRRSNRWSVVDKNGIIICNEPWRGVEGNQTAYRG